MQLNWKKDEEDRAYMNTALMRIDFAKCFDVEAVVALHDQSNMVLHKTTSDLQTKQWKRASNDLMRQLNRLLNEKSVGIWNILKLEEKKTKESNLEAPDDV